MWEREAASITHSLHSAKKGIAKKYVFSDVLKNFIKEPLYSYKLELVFDVPFPPPIKPKFTFIDLFAGIGGFRIALQANGGKCVFSSEIDKAARHTYELNFGEYPYGDLREFTGAKVSDEEVNKWIPDHDVLAAGFPCQPFSLAGVSARNYLGKAHGFLDENQGNLFFDIARIIEIKRPKIVFLENVKNFRNHDGGKTFEVVRAIMEDTLGYKMYSKIINSNKVVPQNRQRFYMVCVREDLNEQFQYQFPEFIGEHKILRSVLELAVPDKYTISDKLWAGHQRRTKNNIERGTGFIAKMANLDKPANTIVARYGKDGKECLIPQDGKNPRKLTPRECARVQGFPENFLLPESDAAAYRQFGNSVSVPVIYQIAEKFKKFL